MVRYTVILEPGEEAWSECVPDLPGCIAAARTREETLGLNGEALALHLAAMREQSEAIPPPTSEVELVPVPA